MELFFAARITTAACTLALGACTAPETTGEAGPASEGTRVVTTNASSGAGTTPQYETAGDPEGVARVRGSLYYVKDQRATALVGSQRFSQGISVERNGEILLQDGRRVRLREGEMVTLSGETREAPRGIELPAPTGR